MFDMHACCHTSACNAPTVVDGTGDGSRTTVEVLPVVGVPWHQLRCQCCLDVVIQHTCVVTAIPWIAAEDDIVKTVLLCLRAR